MDELRLAGTAACAALGVLFACLGLGFAAAGPKAALWVSGFNTLPPADRACYDTARLSRDYARKFAGWSVLLLAGSGLGGRVSGWGAAGALALWAVWFFRSVHWEPERAFGRYRLPQDGGEPKC